MIVKNQHPDVNLFRMLYKMFKTLMTACNLWMDMKSFERFCNAWSPK